MRRWPTRGWKMLTSYNKAVLRDLKGKRDLDFEVNFSKNPDFVECVRVTMGKEEAIIPLEDIYGFIMIAGTPKQQDDLLPIKQTLVKKIIKRHVVQATKDIKKGEMINFRCETNIPVEVVEGLKGLVNTPKMFAVK